ncbi:MAG: DsrE family protein [Bacteroidota bacterium]
MKQISCLLPIFLFLSVIGMAQEKEAGPIMEAYGEVWKIENPDFETDTTMEYKVVFDIMQSPESPTELNRSIETAARFLNMHAQSNVPESQLKVALVVHSKASKDVITNEAYLTRFGTQNPNTDMINQLMKAGVEVILCGQSSKSRNYRKEALIPGVKISLSAMTALIQLQNKGYQLIKF